MYRYLLVGVIPAEVSLLVATETVPFALLLLLLGVDLHQFSLASKRHALPGNPASSCVAALGVPCVLCTRGTCRTTCSVFRTAGGSNLPLVPLWFLRVVVSWFNSMSLFICLLLLPLFVHDDDMLLPFSVGVGNIDADIGDDRCIPWWDASLYGVYQYSSLALIAPSSRQLGFSL